ncbi:MAG: right-handed parallel beta-helix repeat-containing protein [Thermoguttaceae bacterium]|jgi:parallel beta-helix repeat protein
MSLRKQFAWALFAGTWLATAAVSAGSAQAGPPPPGKDSQRAEIRVGIDQGDIRGADNRALQAAVDSVAALGGGSVRIGPGRYLMRNALTLRDNVDIAGVPGKTILAACDGFQCPLVADGDCRQREITVRDPSGFRVGDGVSIQDDKLPGGFEVTTATLTDRVDPNTFRISMPLYLDYMVSNHASARLVFPLVGGWQVKNVAIEGLALDGNRGRAEPLNGCRGGGIYLFECQAITVRNCVVREYNGDGISFQVSDHVTIENCLSEDNNGLGLHPGSGSQFPVLRHNRSLGNGGDGLFVCWRVKHGLFENNEIRGNRHDGISIGHKDTDNVFRNNTILGNGAAGVEFRNEQEAMGAHRNLFEDNRILDNWASAQGETKACIVIRGPHHDLVFRRNTLGNSKPGPAVIGILAGPQAAGLKSEDNRFLNVKTEIATGP